ncbi:hypothetical protein [Mycobacterium sp. GA-2829]|uniref:hypothetical protein n=1 Tax=Mycobacterium sp. GA-2829 TaxID=1772283 RepID=UPI00073FCCA0|nr:hypothetical protein [Mycobacterium sp. GA-2829]KUI22339.1 hypothetical protein AU194_06295 [Mycobacterium sp. GA-2829]
MENLGNLLVETVRIDRVSGRGERDLARRRSLVVGDLPGQFDQRLIGPARFTCEARQGAAQVVVVRRCAGLDRAGQVVLPASWAADQITAS